jgi:carboxymethylenebutenolidase
MTTITLETPDGSMPAYDAAPAGTARGAVVVVQEAFGVNPHIEDVARRFAEAGYRAVAPHLFHRSGDPALGYDDREQIWPHMQALTLAGLEADLDATVGHLQAAGFGQQRIGVVGFCMGGTVAFLAGVRAPLGAAVTFYGGGVLEGRFGMPPLVEMAPRLQSPWLGLFGDQDQAIPVEHVEALRAAVSGAAVDSEIVRYADAGHGFHCDARPESYDEAAAADGWRRTLDWFDRHLAAPG